MGFSCDLWEDPSGRCWENFVHNTDVLVLEGRLEIEIEGVIKHLTVGDELFIPAGANHCVRNIGGTKAKWLYGYR